MKKRIYRILLGLAVISIAAGVVDLIITVALFLYANYVFNFTYLVIIAGTVGILLIADFIGQRILK